MTLDTSVLLVAPRSTAQVHTFVNAELLGKPDAHLMDVEHWEKYSPGRKYFGNAGMQGLNAWFMGYTAGDGPVKAQRYVDEVPSVDGGYEEVWEDLAEGAMMLSFDTAYSFNVAGAGCADLHAYFVLRLAQEYGLVWWQDEFNGTWHRLDGSSDLALNDELVTLIKFGDPRLGKLAVEAARAQ